jgi:Aldo/keto reductase family
MEYRRLGNSGLHVSRIALGCMSFGDTSRGFSEWSLGDEEAQPFLQQAVELGITFWDTANIYARGSSEEIVGRALKKYTRREDIVLATKVFFKMHDGPGGSGLSRKAIMEQIDASLGRLGTDYVDLYQIHRFDPNTSVEETMEALHDVVKAGKARYLGASSMWAWQFAKDAARRRSPRLDPVRLHAGPVQPDAARGGARDVRPARRPRRGQYPVQPPGQRQAGPAVGRTHPNALTPTRSVAGSTTRATASLSTPSNRSPKPRASRWRMSRSLGY